MRTLALLLGLALTLSTGTSSAQSRPTSDDLSILSGRTVGNGEVVLSGGLGWPGFWVEVLLSPTSRFDLSIRAHVDYGAQVGFSTALGGGLSLPMRLHVYGHDDIDVALALRPFALVGEGATVGQQGTFANDVGYGLGVEGGARVGFHLGDVTTIALGATALFAWTDVPDADGAGNVLGAVAGIFGVEGVMTRSTMLFLEAQAGYAFVAEGLFDRPLYVRLSVGMSYRL